jgi:fatty acyl-CoA reductase
MLCKEVNIIINCAASVDMTDSLKNLIQIDYIGPIRVLELAKECQNLDVLSYVSTAYVNSN